MTDRDDRILDACLEEVLGEQSPPDLSDRILNTLATRAGNAASARLPGEAPRPVPVPLRESVSPVSAPSASRSAWQKPAWITAAVAAGLLIAVAGYSQWRGKANRHAERELVQQPHKRPAESAPRHDGDRAPEHAPRNPQPPASRPDESMIAAPGSAAKPPKPVTPLPDAHSAPRPGAVVTSPPVVETPAEPPETPRHAPSPRVASGSRSDAEIIAEINGLVRARWTVEGIKPAVAASESEWCRRVYLDIVGRVPTLEETTGYLAQRGPRKRTRLIDRLMNSDTGVEEYARNWTNIWSSLLIGRTSQPGGAVNREGMQQYLRRSLLRNKPYDEMVAELISAEGVNTPGAEGFNGAVNFVLGNLDVNCVPITAKTARLFLGVQVQCTQCHNHPFNDYRQDQFWEFNSFFRQAKAEPIRRDGKLVATRLVDVDFAGESGRGIDEAEVFWEMRNGTMKASYPTFIDGTRIGPSGAVGKVNRRDELARFVVRSPEMPRALVNRLWGHFLGYGFTRTVDDMGPHNPPSHPALLDLLAREFASHGFDLKRLVSWIALSEPYALSSRMSASTLKDRKDEPAAGALPLFSYFYARQMRPEDLYESLLVLAGNREEGDLARRQRAKNQWLEQFSSSYETEENDEYTTFNGSITQTLMMFNGELMRATTRVDQSTLLRSIIQSEEKPTAKITQLFLAALARRPSNTELQMAHQLWLDRQHDGAAALQDLWWALLNSNEFIMNH